MDFKSKISFDNSHLVVKKHEKMNGFEKMLRREPMNRDMDK